jgi:hypothetical protein
VLHGLKDPTTLYPQYFELRRELTPYLGYYYAVHGLAYLFPIEVANRVFLTIYAIGFPLSLAFLLRSLGRQTWPALLAVPVVYADSFAWGFIGYCAALPLVFLSLGLFVRALVDGSRRMRWTALFAATLFASFTFQPLPLGFMAIALPFVLLTTRIPEDAAGRAVGRRLRARVVPVLGVVPGLIAAVAWAFGLGSRPEQVQWGVPHQVWGPLLSPANLDFIPAGESLSAIPWLLANNLRDGSDRLGLYAASCVAILAVFARFFSSAPERQPRREWYERIRGPGLVAIALGLFLWLPLNVHGRIYYLSPRFVHLVAALAVLLVPQLGVRSRRWALRLAAVAALMVAVPLCRGFRQFDREAQGLQELSMLTGERPKIMGLIFDTGSRVVWHQVYLHSAARLAWPHGGIPNYSFALEPHAPVRYGSLPPPSFVSEWHPADFSYDEHGPAYDHFLVRGARPDSIFGERLGRELYLAGREGGFSLVRRRR